MKTLKSNLSTNNAKHITWDEEEVEEFRNSRIMGKKMDKRRPVQNWKKAWSEHTEDFDEVDDFYEH